MAQPTGPARALTFLLNCAHFIGQGVDVDLWFGDATDPPLEFEARLFDVNLRPKREGGERVVYLRAPARYWDNLYAAAGHIGHNCRIGLQFKQLPLAGSESPSNGRRRARV